MGGGNVVDDLTDVVLCWLATWVSAELSNLTRLSPLVFYLIIGCVMGNTSVIGHSEFLTSFAELSITIVFFALGFEENVKHFMDGIKKAWGIALIGAAVPFLVGFGGTFVFWPGIDGKQALMAGLAVTATAVSLTMISLKDVGLATSKPAIGIMTSAVLDDVGSLALVAVMTPIATGEAEVTAGGIALILGKAAIFFALVFLCHLMIFPDDVKTGLVSRIPVVRSLGIRRILQSSRGGNAMLVSLLWGLFFGMVAVWLGFHPAIGAYMAGLIMEESYFTLQDGSNIYHHVLHMLESGAYSWLGPIFFVHLGATIEIDGDVLLKVLPYSVALYAALGVGQFFSASLSAKYVPGGFTWAESWMIGFGMLGRAELFFVVLNTCKSKGLFDKEMFSTLTLAALLLDVTVPVAITCYRPVYVRMQQAAEDALEKAEEDEGDIFDQPQYMMPAPARQTSLHYGAHALPARVMSGGSADEHPARIHSGISARSAKSSNTSTDVATSKWADKWASERERDVQFWSVPAAAQSRRNAIPALPATTDQAGESSAHAVTRLLLDYDAFLFDCEGTLYADDTAAPFVSEAIAHLRMLNKKVFFVTNASYKSSKAMQQQLVNIGVPCDMEECFPTDMFTARYIKNTHPEAKRVYIIGGQSLVDAFSKVGLESSGGPSEDKIVFQGTELQAMADAIAGERYDGVVVGWGTPFNHYKNLKSSLIFQKNPNCFFYATNGEVGERGNGRLLPALEASCAACVPTRIGREQPFGPEAVWLGKPNPEYARLIAEWNGIDVGRAVMIGDHLNTDIAMGNQAGMGTCLVLSGLDGIHQIGRKGITPTFVLPDVGALRNPPFGCPTPMPTPVVDEEPHNSEGCDEVALSV